MMQEPGSKGLVRQAFFLGMKQQPFQKVGCWNGNRASSVDDTRRVANTCLPVSTFKHDLSGWVHAKQYEVKSRTIDRT